MAHRILFFQLFFLPGILLAQAPEGWEKQANFSGGVAEKGIAFAAGQNGFAGLGTDNAGFRKDFWKYSPEKNSWEQMEKFPAQPRVYAASFSIGTKGYMGTGMVGVESTRQGSNDFWEYDTEKNLWTQKTNFPGGARYAAIGFSIKGKGYISLGSSQNTLYNDLWEYTPETNKWNKKADFPESGKADASVFVIGSEAFVLCGQGKEILPGKKSSWKYSPDKNEWAFFADFPGSGRVGAFAFSHNKKGFVLGGTNGPKRFQDFWEYDSQKDGWTARQNVPFGGAAYGFVFTLGNFAYVCPAKSSSGSSGAELWRFNLDEKPAQNRNLIVGASIYLGDERIPLAGAEMKILNSKQEIIKTVYSNLFGSFLFTGLPENEGLILTFDVSDPTWKDEKFYIVNSKNESVAILDKDNAFRFYLSSTGKNKIQLIKVENKNLRMNMKGKLVLDDKKKTPLENAVVTLMDDQEQVVQAGTTDANGTFIFNYLPVDSTVYLSIDDKTIASLSKGAKILLLDEEDNQVSKTTTANAEFQLTNLPPEKNSLAKVYMEDPWLFSLSNTKEKEMHVVEFVYFDYGKWEILSGAKAVLNKAVAVLKSSPDYSIEISAHTDSRGDAKSNQELSEKRANAAKEYLVSKGISPGKLSSKGYGETRLANKCKDGINCPEEEHAQNRRMEFVIRRK